MFGSSYSFFAQCFEFCEQYILLYIQSTQRGVTETSHSQHDGGGDSVGKHH